MKFPIFFVLLLCGLAMSSGCELADPDTAPQTDETTANGSATGSEWRDGRDVGIIEASNGVVKWETQNVEVPPGLNTPGDAEWIIARVEGQGFSRLLIMTMDTGGGARDPSRILLEGPGGGFWDGRFSVPISGVARWRVQSSEGALRIFLNGNEILSIAGNYTVERAIMTDSPQRGFIGQWRPTN